MNGNRKLQGCTHTRELDAAVTAFGSGTLLLDVQVSKVAARSLDDADPVGPRVVPDQEIICLVYLLAKTDSGVCR
jgi:hypothetical protein